MKKKVLAALLGCMMLLCSCGAQDGASSGKGFEKELSNVVNQLRLLNSNCDIVASAVYKIWSNVDTSDVLSTFQYALLFNDAELSWDEYPDYINKESGLGLSKSEVQVLLFIVAKGINPSSLKTYSDIGEKAYTGDFKSDADRQDTINQCAALKTAYFAIKDTTEALDNQMRDFINSYKEGHSDEIAILNEWYIESELFADFALSPSGTKINYSSSLSEYRESMNRYSKKIDLYL